MLQAQGTPSRFGLPRGANARRLSSPASEASEPAMDYTTKLLHLAWHPEANVIAAAASNSLYMYCAGWQ